MPGNCGSVAFPFACLRISGNPHDSSAQAGAGRCLVDCIRGDERPAGAEDGSDDTAHCRSDMFVHVEMAGSDGSPVTPQSPIGRDAGLDEHRRDLLRIDNTAFGIDGATRRAKRVTYAWRIKKIDECACLDNEISSHPSTVGKQHDLDAVEF